VKDKEHKEVLKVIKTR